MFASSKVSQSMIDAVNKVLGENQTESNETVQITTQQTQSGEVQQLAEAVKETTPTGMKVFGSSYGNSAKAKQDQTKSSIDNLKGPKDKEVKEELKGNQDKIDANHNDKIDSQDFKILRGKKKVKEETTFASKLMEKVKSNVSEKKDVVMPEEVRKSDVPAYLRKAKGDTPLTVADVKAPKKDSISAPENLAKARNEEVEQVNEDNLDSIAKKHGMEFNRTTYGAGMKHPKHGEISINRYGEWHHTGTKAQGDSTNKFASLDKHLSTLKEEVEQIDELSKDTLKSYAAKAAMGNFKSNYDLKKSQSDWDNSIIKKRITKRPEASAADQAKAAKRTAGVHKANAKAAGRPTRPEDMIDLDKIMDRINQSNRINTKEEFQLDQEINEVLSKDASAGDWIHDFVHSDNPKFAGKSKAERKKMALGAYYGTQKESYLPADTAITTDTLAGRGTGGKSNSFQSFKSRVKPLDKEGNGNPEKVSQQEPEETPSRASIKAKPTNNLASQKVNNLDTKFGKTPGFNEGVEVDEATIAGTPGWEKIKGSDKTGNITDKSGAVHTPMSRAKDLARSAFTAVQNRTKIKSK